MKLTKKLTALILSLLMAISLPATAFAAEYSITITPSQGIDYLYEGAEYTLTAVITNANAEDANSDTEFVWSCSSDAVTSLQTSSNKRVQLNSDDTTYTVSQDAKITMPAAGTTFTVTAAYGTSSRTIELTSKQPITSFGFKSEQTAHSYFDSTSNTIYADRRSSKTSETEFFPLTVENMLPEPNDDLFNAEKISSTLSKTLSIMTVAENDFRLFIPNDATGKFELTISTFSGSTSKKCNVQICVPAKSYTLTNSTASKEVVGSGAETGAMTIIQGKPVTITTKFNDSSVNDGMRFELYNSSNMLAPADYCSTSGTSCTLNVATQGTYYLHCKNISKDNGMLDRSDLSERVITVTVNKANPIQNIKLYRLDDEGNRTDKELSEITLYKEAADNQRTFTLANSVVCTPNIEDTSGDKIYYETDDKSIATVDTNGKIEAKGKGTTTIRVKSTDNTSAYAELTVNVKNGTNKVNGITKQDGSVIIPSGHTQQLTANTTPASPDDELFWYSENTSVLEINSKTGEITAKDVDADTQVKVSATADSGATNSLTLTVVPARPAASLTLSAETDSTTASVTTDEASGYTVYTDYHKSTASSIKPFVITANAPDAEGQPTNDEYSWKVAYDGNAGITLDEAKADGLINYIKVTDNIYSITPLQLGSYLIKCAAVTNTKSEEENASDVIYINMLQTAENITVKDAGTDTNTGTSIYLPIGNTKEITVKTSTKDNDRKVDPPSYKITEGAEYISVTERPSDDNEGVTYTISGLKYGTAKITFSSKSSISSVSKSITFYVRNNLNSDNVTVTGYEESVEYTGSKITFSGIKVYSNGTSVDTDQYSISYKDNTNAGTASIVITGKKNFDGSVRTITFTITPRSINANTVTIASIANQELTKTKREVTPTPKVTYGKTTLTKGTSYELTYSNNTSAGVGTVFVTGIGNYSGTLTADFNVIDVADYFTVDSVSNQVYTGKEIKPQPTIKYFGKTLKNNVDYTLSYSNNINAGIATITIKGMGSYKGTITANFTIIPKTEAVKFLKKGKKQFKVKWKKQTDISGYQIQYATNKKFKKKKSKVVKDANTTSLTVKKLKSKKTYYVRVRSYKEVNGKKIYGKWSKVKKVKTK